MYSLGLIFYELFTGQAVHQTSSVPELMRAHEESSPSQPSSLVEDMDASVERVILRCLEKEPGDRPKFVQAVSAALPGGDPLAAALAAGETPSPEMVAAAGETGELPLKVGIALLSVICALLIALPILASWMDTHKLGRLRENEPAVLKHDAVQWLKQLGYKNSADAYPDSTYQFGKFQDFRYRQSSRPLQPRITILFGSSGIWQMSEDNPSLLEPGMTSVRLDASKPYSPEQLLEFLAVPETDESGGQAEAITADRCFQLVGLDPSAFSPVADAERWKNWRPPIYSDDVSVWRGPDGAESQVIMATRNNRLVYFRRVIAAGDTSGFSITRTKHAGNAFLTILAVVFSGVLALRNLRLGRTDNRGALCLAVYYFAVDIVLGIVVSHHVTDPSTESELAANHLIYSLARSLRVWLYYVGFEPYARRLWPDVLITWSRVLSGRFRDPLVGRDLMVGTVFATVFVLAVVANGGSSSENLNSADSVLGSILVTHQMGLLIALYYMAILLLCKVFAINTPLAVGLFTVIGTLSATITYGTNSVVLEAWILKPAFYAAMAMLYVRFGLLAVVTGLFCNWLLTIAPHTTDFGAWYAVTGNFALATVLLVTFYGFYISTLAGRSFTTNALKS